MKAVLGLRPLWLAVVCGLASSLLPLFAVPAPRPNVLVILTDDQRWDAMSCAGHPLLKTPNMDRLAAEGARFANMFVTTSLCSPSRASMLSGLYAHRHGVLNNFTEYPDSLRYVLSARDGQLTIDASPPPPSTDWAITSEPQPGGSPMT